MRQMYEMQRKRAQRCFLANDFIVVCEFMAVRWIQWLAASGLPPFNRIHLPITFTRSVSYPLTLVDARRAVPSTCSTAAAAAASLFSKK